MGGTSSLCTIMHSLVHYNVSLTIGVMITKKYWRRHCLLLNVHLCLAKYPAQDCNILSSACCEGHLWASYSCNKHNCHFTLVRIIPVWLKTVWTSLYLLLVWHAFNCYNIWCLFVFSALMRMLVISPHLVTDKVYLHKAVKHAIKCGFID